MTVEDIKLLTDTTLRQTIEQHLEEDPAQVAFTVKPYGALVATQIKYLQRARTKLPAYYVARCIIPPLAYEQSSSETSAAARRYGGDTCIDLTCGLGVDSFGFSRNFERVIAVERDEALAAAARYNFKALGASRIEVVHSTAEDFITGLENTMTRDHCTAGNPGISNRHGCESEKLHLPVDLIYVDPARRGDGNRKLFLLQECSPDVTVLMPRLLKLARRVVVKASPLFDVEEAFRFFGEKITVEAVSLGGECKEIVIEIPSVKAEESAKANGGIVATRAEGGSLTFFRHPSGLQNEYADETTDSRSSAQHTPTGNPGFDPEKFRYLLIPDVSLYKIRRTREYARQIGVYSSGESGYCFAQTYPESFFGRVWPIDRIFPYRPKALREWLRNRGIKRLNILKKNFPQDTELIAKALGVGQGGTYYAAFTRIGGNMYAVFLHH